MKKVLFSFCMATALAGMSSCASTKDAATVSSLEGEWNIIEVNGTVTVPAPGQEFPYIGFDVQAGNVYGCSGCNRLTGAFDVHAKPGRIDLGTLGSTRMMCPDMALEQQVLAALAQVKRYKRIDETNMALCSSSRRPQLVLQKRSGVPLSELQGKWLIHEVDGTEVPAGMEKQPFVEFDTTENRMHASAGCNVINGSFQADEKNPSGIKFSRVITTMMACPDMTIERKTLAALNATRSVGRTEEGGIALYDADHTPVMVLVRE